MSNAIPMVSVIVPNYNHARFLPKRMESIFAQRYQDFELILLDDCSTDESREILSRYAGDPRVRIAFNEANSGSTFRQWNKGVGMARGQYVWIAESDDYADERLLERLVGALEADERVTFAYCRSHCVSGEDAALGFADTIYFPDLEPECWTKDFVAEGMEECRRHFVRFNVPANASSVVFRRAAYEKVGGPDQGMRLCADWKFWAEMALEGRVAYVAEPLNYFRFHGGSVRKRIARAEMAIEHMRTAGWILERVGSAPKSVLEGAYLANRTAWVPSVLSRGVPLAKKREIMRAVRTFDPYPIWRLMGWFGKHMLWAVWCPILDFTYDARHALGLTSNGLARLKARFRSEKREAAGAG
jgi:glycosyltransferase involved in cell wall biosynthesis